MIHEVNGVSMSAYTWAKAFSTDEASLNVELRQGKTMTQIANERQPRSLLYRPPTPLPLQAPSSSYFTKGLKGTEGQPLYSVASECLPCTLKAKDALDAAHESHLQKSKSEKDAADLLFAEFINCEGERTPTDTAGRSGLKPDSPAPSLRPGLARANTDGHARIYYPSGGS